MAYTADKHGHETMVYEAPENMSAGRYLATRLPTLKPPMNKIPNPISLLRLLNTQQWMFFLIGFLGQSSHCPLCVSVHVADSDQAGHGTRL